MFTVLALCGPGSDEHIDDLDPAFSKELAGRVNLVTIAEVREKKLHVDGIIAMVRPKITASLLDELSGPSGIKVISSYGVGVEHIDVAACKARGIPIGFTPGGVTDPTADMAWALLMACARRIPEADQYTRHCPHPSYKNFIFLGADVSRATIGIIGLGRIGTAIAKRAMGFKMNILYHNRNRNHAAEEAVGAHYCTLADLLRQSDYVVIACPAGPETKDMINAETLTQMKTTAFLINISRGSIVDTDALVHALEHHSIAGAGLDVTEPEPLPRDHKLLTLGNVVIAPHRGAATTQTRVRQRQLTIDNLMNGLNHEPLVAQFVQ